LYDHRRPGLAQQTDYGVIPNLSLQAQDQVLGRTAIHRSVCLGDCAAPDRFLVRMSICAHNQLLRNM
jgi:hypothetical protein